MKQIVFGGRKLQNEMLKLKEKWKNFLSVQLKRNGNVRNHAEY